MNSSEISDLTKILIQIRDNQTMQIEKQTEALLLQREQFELVKTQFEQAKRIQDRAELLQEKSAKLVEGSRRFTFVVLQIITVLLIILGIYEFLY